MVVFSGYCSWGRGQLEREVESEMWDLSQGTEEDVLRSNIKSIW